MENNAPVVAKETKKQLSVDLILIGVITFIALGIVMSFYGQLNDYLKNDAAPIVLRVLAAAACQFAVAGLGITTVCLIRKESFRSFGLNTKNLFPALGLSLLCCVPDFIYQLCRGNVHPWCPFIDVHTTREALASAFPSNVLAMLITAAAWGFFEGFNYVVIGDKFSKRFPSKHKLFDWGALICAIMCILVHGVVGVTPDALLEMLLTIFMIYGMLIVRKLTGNAWGCVLIFFVYWNAL